MSTGTIIRTALLALALINQVLVIAGIPPLPITDDQINEGISLGFTVVASVWAWWKLQSTRPQGARRAKARQMGESGMTSIHAPARGATSEGAQSAYNTG